MTDDAASEASPPLELLQYDTDGYCDPTAGVCVLPGATDPQAAGSLNPGSGTAAARPASDEKQRMSRNGA
ncbi:hypothetical protein ACGFY7_02455 [Streptomyces prunicolor]|uniref:hypothetical protein n=1 Tax=Streptomyces prunicolor TaxID=67348 RepID=UPI00371092FA